MSTDWKALSEKIRKDKEDYDNSQTMQCHLEQGGKKKRKDNAIEARIVKIMEPSRWINRSKRPGDLLVQRGSNSTYTCDYWKANIKRFAREYSGFKFEYMQLYHVNPVCQIKITPI